MGKYCYYYGIRVLQNCSENWKSIILLPNRVLLTIIVMNSGDGKRDPLGHFSCLLVN